MTVPKKPIQLPPYQDQSVREWLQTAARHVSYQLETEKEYLKRKGPFNITAIVRKRAQNA